MGLEERILNSGKVLYRESTNRKPKILLLYSFSLFIWEGKNFHLPSMLSWWFCQSSLLVASTVASFCMLSCLLDGPPDFWLWVDWWRYRGRNILSVVIQVKVVIHLARSSYMSSMHSCIWMRDFCSLLQEIASNRVDRLWFVILGPLAWAFRT